jgi:hypothetical protein
MRTDLPPRIEHRLVDRVTRRTKLGRQRIQRNPIDDERLEHAALPLTQRPGDSRAECLHKLN